jgi:ERCC4-related helicase
MSAATAAVGAAAAAGASSAAATAAAAAAPNYQLLVYEQQIVQEMVEQDALCIMGAGLGWHRVIAAMLQMHDSSSNGERLRQASEH